ncbi:hypothetical protein QFC21_000098 [Naganishia friedmannii]|uniref:Uncharacterized protein n=1 Tax=Naganishia friedmannii TaxID=89922 RepID=A0ACC2WBE6_9TREE|nr:hypothetical protein QFC21_000098 [Naganishia friedmannii]
MQQIREGGTEVADQPLKATEVRPGTPKCEITYDFDPKDHSPTYAKLLKSRIAIGRRQELEKAARSEEPPDDEELTECCGSRCKPCVKELFHEKVDVWSECEAIRDKMSASHACNNKSSSKTCW